MKILIAGDLAPQERVSELLCDGTYCDVLADLIPYTSKVDYSILNLEIPIKANAQAQHILKVGPVLCSPPNVTDMVKESGFDCVTLANNHFYDFGDEGVEETLAACKKSGLDTVGGGKNFQEASKILYKYINGQTLAIINCCEHEFSIATDTSGGSNPLNPIQQYYAIKEACEKANYVLVIVHGGHEMYQLPSPRMQETYRFFIDSGADAVINHHQHCYSGYEVYKGKPIFYGLGNLCIDSKKRQGTDWDNGYFVVINISSSVIFDVIPYVQCNPNPIVRILGGYDANRFEERIRFLNSIIGNNSELSKEFEKFCKCREKEILFRLSSYKYYRKLIRKLIHFGIINLKINKKKGLNILNLMNCESHRDVASFVITKNLFKL